MKILQIIIFLPLILTSLFCDDINKQLTRELLFNFQGYCYNSNANYNKITDMVKIQKLKELSKKFANSVAPANSTDNRVFVLMQDDKFNIVHLLNFSKPDSCSVMSDNHSSNSYIREELVKTFDVKEIDKEIDGFQTVYIYKLLKNNGIIMFTDIVAPNKKQTAVISYTNIFNFDKIKKPTTINNKLEKMKSVFNNNSGKNMGGGLTFKEAKIKNKTLILISKYNSTYKETRMKYGIKATNEGNKNIATTMKEKDIKEMCSFVPLKELLDNGIDIKTQYLSSDDIIEVEYVVAKKDCK